MELWRINERSFNINVFNNQFLGLDSTGIKLVAISTNSEASGIFEIITKPDDSSRVRIKAPNGLFLQAKTENLVTADSQANGGWGNDDPSVFEMTIVQRFQGEYQITNGYGLSKAPKIMKEKQMNTAGKKNMLKDERIEVVLGDSTGKQQSKKRSFEQSNDVARTGCKVSVEKQECNAAGVKSLFRAGVTDGLEEPFPSIRTRCSPKPMYNAYTVYATKLLLSEYNLQKAKIEFLAGCYATSLKKMKKLKAGVKEK